MPRETTKNSEDPDGTGREMTRSWREPYVQRKVERGTNAPASLLSPSNQSHWTNPTGSGRHETSADVAHTGQPPGLQSRSGGPGGG